MKRYRPIARAAKTGMLLFGLLDGCGGEDLGECQPGANELVYAPGNLVATKGQALMHDSCGKGVFCHSSGAGGEARRGAPADIDFDMLPSPKGLAEVLSRREEIWDQVVSGDMPPAEYAANGSGWLFDQQRRSGAPTLPDITTDEGKGVLRNWLACAAPVVVESTVPSWATEPLPQHEPVEDDGSEWNLLHSELRNRCVSSGCHDSSFEQTPEPPGRLPLFAGECVVYRWLTSKPTECGARLVVGGDPDASDVLRVMEGGKENEACELVRLELAEQAGTELLDEHPTAPRELREDMQSWIASGAFAPQCGVWSDRAPREAAQGGEAGTGSEVPSGPPTWSEVYSEIIEGKACTSCHTAEGAAASGMLDLSDQCVAFEQLLGEKGACDEPRVVAGNPVDSMLLDKLANESPRCGKTRMPPPPFPALTGSEVQLVRDWIEAGALVDADHTSKCE